MTTDIDHILVTPPDRYWSDAFNILLVDFDFQLAENIINPLRSSTINLAIHLYSSNEDNHEWLLNVANASDIIVLNLTQITNNDLFKGQLINECKPHRNVRSCNINLGESLKELNLKKGRQRL